MISPTLDEKDSPLRPPAAYKGPPLPPRGRHASENVTKQLDAAPQSNGASSVARRGTSSRRPQAERDRMGQLSGEINRPREGEPVSRWQPPCSRAARLSDEQVQHENIAIGDLPGDN